MASELSNTAARKRENEDSKDVIIVEECPAMDQIDATQFEKLSSGEFSEARRSTGETTIESSQLNTPIHSDQGQKFLAQDVFLSHSEIQEECPPTDQIDTTQVMNSSSREYWRSTVEMINSGTIKSSQPNTPIRSDRGLKFSAQDVFLSHSGKQKNFIRQLYRDLTNQGVSCFFDQDRESLPVGEDFPSRIFEAAKTCKVAVLLLSMDFLESKWPMQELAAFVETKKKTNLDLKILPLFFQISPDALKNITADDEKWKQLEKSEVNRAEWHQALSAIRPINGLNFIEGDDEVKFRDEIVKGIWHLLPTPLTKVSCLLYARTSTNVPGG
ncbi:uncharacterized protein LOC131054851 isoform X2 [Cryptomeria japonica]|uniref:uncharacterized protein LOC131054851 isoform X2 n=1 Tax=Cryptomeria japonica TaxID=3369 RepID=UPI0025AB93B4|nr:uncharacterized protein LOC131054851 isoform X2 [Cryptomeria japonica]